MILTVTPPEQDIVEETRVLEELLQLLRHLKIGVVVLTYFSCRLC